MNSVRIVADSGCDLTPELVSRYEISVVPCFVRFGQEMVSDDTMDVEEFWRRAAKLDDAPGTAAPPPGAFQTAYQRLISAGHDVLCLTLPRQHSAIYNSAWLGAQEFGRDHVRVVDSRSISLGMGVQVIEAAKRALAGASLEAVQRAVEIRRRPGRLQTPDLLLLSGRPKRSFYDAGNAEIPFRNMWLGSNIRHSLSLHG